MFLESIKILTINVCVQIADRFIATTRASRDVSEVFPYLNTFLRRADYNPNACSIKFISNKIEFTLIKDQINVAKFVNRTELLELLDWVQALINDTYDSMAELTPRYTTRKQMPALTIYTMLPKTNCQKCGEKSCMAFAARLTKMEIEIEDCPILLEPEYDERRLKLENSFD